MKYVVKLGGAGLEIPSLLEGCMRAIAELARDGARFDKIYVAPEAPDQPSRTA